ncbi:MAG: 50S ribosomal protein L21 [Candidatus Limnocylindrales bacterium]
MYAVIESGGKQYRVELGTEIAVDRMDVEAGQTVQFDHVLLVADDGAATVGRPHVSDARVSADVVRHARGEKIVVFKYRPKARSRVKQGARADLTVLRIADIVHGSHSAARVAEAARTERERLEAAAAEAAAAKAEADRQLAGKLAKATAAAEAKTAAAKAAQAAPARRGGAKADAAAPSGKGGSKSAPTTKPTTKAPKAPSARTQAPPPAAKPAARKKKEE